MYSSSETLVISIARGADIIDDFFVDGWRPRVQAGATAIRDTDWEVDFHQWDFHVVRKMSINDVDRWLQLKIIRKWQYSDSRSLNNEPGCHGDDTRLYEYIE